MKNLNKEQYKGILKQYLDTKEFYKDYLLLYQVGNFVVAFFNDAYSFSKITGLSIVDYGKHKVARSGFPLSSLDKYENILDNKNCSYVIYMEDMDSNKLKLKNRSIFKFKQLKYSPYHFLGDKQLPKYIETNEHLNIKKYLEQINLSKITPIEALNILSELKCKFNY